MHKKKIGLVLEGGGVKGAYQAGVMRALGEYGAEFDGIAGTSIGAVNGSVFLQGGYGLVSNIWDDVTARTLFGIDDEIISKFQKKDFDLDMFFYAGKKLTSLRELIRTSYNSCIEFIKAKIDEESLRKSPLDFGIVTYNLTDMKPVEAMKQDLPEGLLLDFIIASATYPIFPAKVIEGKKYIDGGVYDNMPVNLLANNGYDRMLVIRTNTQAKQPKRKLARDDLELFYVAPKNDLGHAMSFTEKKIINFRELGYNDGVKAIKAGLGDFLNCTPAIMSKISV